jgi:glyoxylase-like metal-dependent hydrolase (beta-lactamase superfamily II)
VTIRALAPIAALAVLAGGGDPWNTDVRAQQAPAAGVLETIELRPNLHVVFGAGSNVAVHVGPEGAILVDSGSAAMAERLLATVKAITERQIRLIINTSADPDHVGGNQTLAAAGMGLNPSAFTGARQAAILAHENVLNRMSAPTGEQSPFPIGTWPTETYIARTKSMYLNDEGIQVMHQPAAHTDGDSIVVFRRADVIVTGDVVDLRRFPVIDPARGGSVQGELDTLNRLLELAIPAMPLIYKEGRTYLVPGHGRVADHAEIVEYRDMVTVVRDVIADMVARKMTLEQIKAANPTQGYRARYGSDTGPWTTDMFVDAVYKGLVTAGAN